MNLILDQLGDFLVDRRVILHALTTVVVVEKDRGQVDEVFAVGNVQLLVLFKVLNGSKERVA